MKFTTRDLGMPENQQRGLPAKALRHPNERVLQLYALLLALLLWRQEPEQPGP